MPVDETNKDQRQADRNPAWLQVELVLYDNGKKNVLAGPSVAFLRNISRFGGGIILPHIRVNNHHLFYGPIEKSSLLFLEKVCPDNSKTLSIQLQPKWYRLEDTEERHFFRVGIEFIKGQSTEDILYLRNIAKEFILPGKNWLSSFFFK